MKAKEYAARLNQEPTKDKLLEILNDFIQESKELMEKRNITRDSAVFAVLNEQHYKWIAFAKRVDDIEGMDVNPLGFTLAVCDLMPRIAEVWKFGQDIVAKADEGRGVRK